MPGVCAQSGSAWGLQRLRRYAGAVGNAAVLVIALGVLVQNIDLVRQNRALRRGAALPDVEIHQRLIELRAVSMQGTLVSILNPMPGGKRTLFITMSPSCPICSSNREKWVAMTKALRNRKGWRVCWVSRDSLESTRQYLNTLGIMADEIVAEPPQSTYLGLGLAKVPQMISVSSDGEVERVWRGRLTEQAEAEIAAHLQLDVGGNPDPRVGF